MADIEIELNPRKKAKIDNVTDELGDKNAADSTQDEPHIETLNKGTESTHDNGSGEPSVVQSDEIDSHIAEDVSRMENGSDDSNGSNLPCDNNDDNRMGSESGSDVSSISDMSDLSGEESWKARNLGPLGWVYKAMEDRVDPRVILRQAIPDEADIPDVDNFTLWKLVVNLVSEPPPRKKLADVNTLDDVIQLLHKCQKIMVLTGAGVSVSCGIPDFRSRNGIYARLAVDFPDLPDPQAMFDISYFRKDQRPFFKFAKEIFPGQFEPSKSHKFIKLIEEHGKLLRNYTQNIDTLEQVAGINNVIQCHGSFATATCMTCHHKISMENIKSDVMEQQIPWCTQCDPRTPLSIMKPDIVFFGESLPEEFHNQMSLDKDQCDLLIVIGSSLKVRPVALIPNSLPEHVPQILINKEHLRHLNFDVELLGDCDAVVNEICRRLGNEWTKICDQTVLTEIGKDDLLTPPQSPSQLTDDKPDSAISTTGRQTASIPKSESVDTTDKCVSDTVSKGDKVIDSSTVGEAESKEADNKPKSPRPVTSCNVDETPLTVTSDCSVNTVLKDDLSSTGKQTESETIADSEQPGCSYDDSELLSADSNLITSSDWIPKRLNVADRLGENQFCFIPPCQYVFPEAEFYSTLNDNDSDDDNDTSMDSDSDIDLAFTTTTTTENENDNDDKTELNGNDSKKENDESGASVEKPSPAELNTASENSENC